MAATLAVIAAICFALAAALQQRGQFRLAQVGKAIRGLAGLVRLLAVPVWLGGTLVLFAGYATQAAALDRGRIVVVQPLMVTTIVWALPLGYWLTDQRVVRSQFLGAGIVVVGLTMFVLVGNPDAGVDSASTRGLLVSAAAISVVVVLLLWWPRSKTSPSWRAAVLGLSSGLWSGLSVAFAKPVLDALHSGIVTAAEDWRTWALLGFGFGGFLIQQLSLATGQLAPAMAAVSVASPAVSVLLGIVLYDERLTPPGWHVAVAFAALLAALGGAWLITMSNRETPIPGEQRDPGGAAVARV
jgi:drug/metabolite transporter (DMT)-like permease